MPIFVEEVEAVGVVEVVQVAIEVQAVAVVGLWLCHHFPVRLI